MSPISLSLDLLLVVLLIAALGFCWRLEKRLKGLKDSHSDFADAVADLDRAALRAETGLAQLRQATDEAVDLLAGRIEKARELTAQLDKLTTQAPRPRAAKDLARPAPERAWSRPAAAPADPMLAAESLARRLSDDDSLVLSDRAPRAPAQTARPAMRPNPPRAAAPPTTPQRPVRARSSFDDDLFETPALALGALHRSR